MRMENLNQPATWRDLHALRDELKASQTQLRDELKEFMRDLQAETLRAFHDYQLGAGAQFRRMRAD